ncbi:STAS domain-containing protein [Tautonia sociabilis]|nr:STAS domain-containing protein [Tautonia sociabilis]
MPIDYRDEGAVTIVGNVAGVLSDARHFDAARDLDALLDQGRRRFVIELSGVGSPGPTALGLLMTLVRQIRRRGGEVAFARVGRSTMQVFEEMQMDAHVDLFRTVAEAVQFLRPLGEEPSGCDDQA